MRGKVTDDFQLIGGTRITPAYAGKSIGRSKTSCTTQDHPRICGEKSSPMQSSRGLKGSPPPMRGKALSSANTIALRRITPAYAGKSWLNITDDYTCEDHPRICGEKGLPMLVLVQRLGSPPHMRGKARGIHHAVDKSGITPAYAGKRLKRSRSTVSPVAIIPLFPSVCNKPVVSDGSPAERDAPLFLPAENTAPASPAYNLRSL